MAAVAPALAQTPPDPESPAWDGSHWSKPINNGETVEDGVFSGTFVHQGSEPKIEGVALDADFAGVHEPACEPAPTPPRQAASTTTTPDPTATSVPSTPTEPTSTSTPTNSTMDFSFDVDFVCNGVYDLTATASLDSPDWFDKRHELELTDIQVSVPPQPPVSLVATDNGNRTVTLTWIPPDDMPPDLLGFRLSRMDNGGSAFDPIGTTPPATFTFTDPNIPAAGGAYFYQIETLRKAAVATQEPLVSPPVTTAEALAVGGGGGGGGGSQSGSANGGGGGQQPGSGVQHFDETTLADDDEPGEGDELAIPIPLPGGGAIQRFAGRDGAGLVKPFAAALDLAVWAALVLFLTRRAKAQARVDDLVVEFEDADQQRGRARLVEGLVPVATLG